MKCQPLLLLALAQINRQRLHSKSITILLPLTAALNTSCFFNSYFPSYVLLRLTPLSNSHRTVKDCLRQSGVSAIEVVCPNYWCAFLHLMHKCQGPPFRLHFNSWHNSRISALMVLCALIISLCYFLTSPSQVFPELLLQSHFCL